MVLLIIIPMKNGYNWVNIPYFQTNPDPPTDLDLSRRWSIVPDFQSQMTSDDVRCPGENNGLFIPPMFLEVIGFWFEGH